MKRRVRGFAAIGFLLLAAIEGFIWYRNPDLFRVTPHLRAHAVPKHSRLLSEAEIGPLLKQEFRLVHHVDQMADALKISFDNFVDWPTIEHLAAQEGIRIEAAIEDLNNRRKDHPHPPLDMADPEQTLGSDDLTQGLPQRRLILCGYSESSGFVLYEQAGFATTTQLTVFDFEQSRAWGGWIKDSKPRTLEEILNIVILHKYSGWNKSN